MPAPRWSCRSHRSPAVVRGGLVLLAATGVLAGCGSTKQSGTPGGSGASASVSGGVGSETPRQVVTAAFAALNRDAYHQHEFSSLRYDVSGASGAIVTSLRAGGLNRTITIDVSYTGSGTFTSTEHLQGVTLRIRNRPGHVAVSENGGPFRAVPGTLGARLTQAYRSVTAFGREATSVRALGTVQNNGISVARYEVTIPPRAILAAAQNLLRTGSVHILSQRFILAVNRSSGLPVQISDTSTVAYDLPPGSAAGSGSLRVHEVNVFTYSNVRAPG